MTAEHPDLELLADLDAGLLDPATAQDVSSAARADPRRQAVLAALAATRADLAALPAPPVPPEYAGRWAAALAATERQPAGTVPPPVARRRWMTPAIAAAALVVVLFAALYGGAEVIPPVSRVQLATAGQAAFGVGDTGELRDPARLAECLRAVAPQGVPPDALLLGGRQVRYEGQPGVLLVLGTGTLGSFHVVVVSPGCGRLLGSMPVGR